MPKINVVRKLTPQNSPVQGDQVLIEGIHYHIEEEDEEYTFTVVLHYEDK